jgi:hypothetical protein
MDKGRKLRRYTRKDYSQLVDFPVEIVGRDGAVRRYSFDESVRLYQRRIASATLRYEDGDIVKAEVLHCEQRIRQLRKSYFARYGWSAVRIVDSPRMLAGEFAGEVVAFLRRVIELPDDQPGDLELAYLDDEEHHQLYFVRSPDELGEDRNWLLYLYRFDGAVGSPGRESFFSFLKVLQGVRLGGAGVEQMVAFHHTADCGLVLTGKGEHAAGASGHGAAEAGADFLDLVAVDSDPLRRGMVLLRKGKRAAALGHFVAAYEQNHYRRAGYVGAVVVADQLGAHGDAETAALMGSRYFPEDAVLLYHLAVARVRQGDARARTHVETLRALSGETIASALLAALVSLSEGDVDSGRRALSGCRELAAETDVDLLHALRTVRGQVAARDLGRLAGAGLIAAGLVIAWMGWLPAIGLSMAGATLIPVVHLIWKRQFRRLLEAPGATGLRLANPAALRADSAGTTQR